MSAASAARVQACIAELLRDHPFWGHLLVGCRITWDDTLPCLAATDGVAHIVLQPAGLAALTDDQLGFVLLHEVGHIVLASVSRRQGRHAVLWNQATDYAINRMVANVLRAGSTPAHPVSRYTPPPGALLDRRFDGLTAERIYDLLREEHRAGGGLPHGEPVTRLGAEAVDHGGRIDVHPPDGWSAKDQDARREGLRAASWARRQDGGRGDLPGEVARVVGSAAARVPWTRLLARHVDHALSGGTLHGDRPSARWLAQDVVRPGLRGRAPHLAVSIDTSGSVDDRLLARFAAEVRALRRRAVRLTLLVGDSAVHEVVEDEDIARWLRRAHAPGQGGTDHRPLFRRLSDPSNQPDLLIAFTDLHTTLPTAPPPYAVVWVCPMPHGEAPWGSVVELRSELEDELPAPRPGSRPPHPP